MTRTIGSEPLRRAPDDAARGPSSTRQSEATRRALIEAATTIFAEQGYEGGSVRAITQKAGANQAAITYHFGGKEGLYAAVLRSAFAALEERSLVDERSVDALAREEALRLLFRQLLTPLAKRDRLGRYIRIFAWESVRPTTVFQEIIERETPHIFLLAERLVRRFRPDAALQDVKLTAFWLTQQPISFVRAAGHLARPPFGLVFDEGSLERLVEFLTDLSLEGLSGRARIAPGGE